MKISNNGKRDKNLENNISDFFGEKPDNYHIDENTKLKNELKETLGEMKELGFDWGIIRGIPIILILLIALYLYAGNENISMSKAFNDILSDIFLLIKSILSVFFGGLK